jgi:hypothetical protein
MPGLITGTGSYHLDRRMYTADLSSEHVKLLGLQLPGGQTIRADVQLAARAMGSVDAPAGTADVTFDGLEAGASVALTARRPRSFRPAVWSSTPSPRTSRRRSKRQPSATT